MKILIRFILVLTMLLTVNSCSQSVQPTTETVTDGLETEARTVTRNRRGFYFGVPYDPGTADPISSPQWKNIGAYIGLRWTDAMSLMPDESLKGVHGLLQHFPKVNTGSGRPYFPWATFKQFNDAGVATGKVPLIMTATYQGKKREVVYYAVSDSGGHDTAVNVADERFAQFFVNEYLNKNILVPGLQNFWMGFDNCEFDYGKYGVIDNSGKFVSTEEGNFKFDKPFPQNDAEYRATIVKGLKRIKELAPNVKFICNAGFAGLPAIGETEKDAEIFTTLDGLMVEDFLDPNTLLDDPFNAWYIGRHFDRLWSVGRNKVQIFQPRFNGFNDTARLRTIHVGYRIFGGPNSFMGALTQLNDGFLMEANPQILTDLRTVLGGSTSLPTFMKEPNPTQDPFLDGYRLYKRTFQKGIAYLNWTGKTKTITLPTDRQFVNRAGQVVTKLTLAYRTGDYVLYK
jgi:hypothetical protein